MINSSSLDEVLLTLRKCDALFHQGQYEAALNTYIQANSDFNAAIEEIYQKMFKKYEKVVSIHLTEVPTSLRIDSNAIQLGKLAIQLISEIRQYKQKKNLSLGSELENYNLKKKPRNFKQIEGVVKGTMRIKVIL